CAVADRDPGAAVADGGASARVRADVVPLDQVVRRLKGEEALDVHAAAGVTGDHVACTGGRASDRVPVREVDEDSRAVAKGGAAGGIRADVVALDEVAARAAQTDADARVAGDQVARPCGRAADRFPASVVLDEHARTVAE